MGFDFDLKTKTKGSVKYGKDGTEFPFENAMEYNDSFRKAYREYQKNSMGKL